MGAAGPVREGKHKRAAADAEGEGTAGGGHKQGGEDLPAADGLPSREDSLAGLRTYEVGSAPVVVLFALQRIYMFPPAGWVPLKNCFPCFK